MIGGCTTGATAALQVRELGAAVALVESDGPGGICTNDGSVSTRVFYEAQAVLRKQ